MNPQVQWWREVGGDAPQRPVLVLASHDDATAISTLPPDFSEHLPGSPTLRVAEHLGVQVVATGADLPDHDLLLLGSVGRGLTTIAAAWAVQEFLAEPQLVTGYGSGISDDQWMDKVADVRSRRFEAVPPPIAGLVAVLESATVPVLLDGVIAAAAAATAGQLPPLQAPVVGAEPAQRFFLDRAMVAQWGAGGIGPGQGLGALAGLAALRLALLAE